MSPAETPLPHTGSPAAPLVLRSALAPILGPDGERTWLRFQNPTETVVAWNLDEVLPAMRRVERAAEHGSWAVGFVSYDAGPAFDPAIVSRRASATPLVAFGIFDSAQPDTNAPGGSFTTGPWTDTVDQAGFEAGVRNVKEHIAAGDTYQVNLTYRMQARFDGDPLGLFRAMARSQRGDHLVYLDFGGHALCSASPELFFRRTPLERGGGRLVSKPMKGTRARASNAADDAALVAELAASEKDRAENTMIVDMMRNDFGRIARIGTVEASELHTVETYPTVHQMVSTVTADTDASIVDTFRSCFPPASITGAPKVSTSRIVAELEHDGRGAYCGAAGVMAPDGRAEFNVAIRSVWIDRAARTATYGTGGGIVWDSDPTLEWLETKTKTRVLTSAPSSFELFETMRYAAGGRELPEILLLDRHLDRLAASADRFGFDININDVRRRLEAIDHDQSLRIRLSARADGSFAIETHPLNTEWGMAREQDPWVVPVDRHPTGRCSVNSADLFLRHKTTHRKVYDDARARYPDAPDVILWNERREVTETTIGNIVVDLDGQLLTPEQECGLLPGTFRAELLEHHKISEAVITLDDLERAQEIFMINSVRGWVPVHLRPA